MFYMFDRHQQEGDRGVATALLDYCFIISGSLGLALTYCFASVPALRLSGGRGGRFCTRTKVES